MRYILIILLTLISNPIYAADDNSVHKFCFEQMNYSPQQFNTVNWNKIASCVNNIKATQNAAELRELRDFLKHNPRYRVPGQSLNRCWGKPREMPIESINASGSPDGSWYVGVNYKDKLPAGCFENGPWDNREENARRTDIK